MKKSEYISFRTDTAAKQVLEKYASEKEWTISHLVENIIQEWVKAHSEETAPDE